MNHLNFPTAHKILSEISFGWKHSKTSLSPSLFYTRLLTLSGDRETKVNLTKEAKEKNVNNNSSTKKRQSNFFNFGHAATSTTMAYAGAHSFVLTLVLCCSQRHIRFKTRCIASQQINEKPHWNEYDAKRLQWNWDMWQTSIRRGELVYSLLNYNQQLWLFAVVAFFFAVHSFCSTASATFFISKQQAVLMRPLFVNK